MQKKRMRYLPGLLGVVCLTFIVIWVIFNSQGDKSLSYIPWHDTETEFDSYRIPTIYGNSWESVYRTQGYVVASERMWQMDLLRRKSGGQLSEIFGTVTLEVDTEKQLQETLTIANKAVELLPPEEKAACIAFAEGVNAFITHNPWRWGAEYIFLRTRPEKWQCRDSILVQMEIIHSLTDTENYQLIADSWSTKIPQHWMKTLFSNEHPWNRPVLGKDLSRSKDIFPPRDAWLPAHPLQPTPSQTQRATVTLGNPELVKGSNNWIYSGKEGIFLANDPHLNYSVPGIFFMNRLHVSVDEWVAGVTVPGIPGIIIGMNPYLAWSFTNTGENVQELFQENIINEQTYLEGSTPTALITKKFPIKVRGKEQPKIVEGKYTSRGLVKTHPYRPNTYYTVQWQLYDPALIRLPVQKMSSSSSLEEFFTAVDNMSLPSQNILVADREGRMAHRISGTGITRNYASVYPTLRNPNTEKWLGYTEPNQRPYQIIHLDSTRSQFLATANQRIWKDNTFHFWSSDDRIEVIRQFLSTQDALTQQDMHELQQNTMSIQRKNMVTYMLEYASPEVHKEHHGFLQLWKAWSGEGKHDNRLFTALYQTEQDVQQTLLQRVAKHYNPNPKIEVPYRARNYRSWLVALLEKPETFAAFGTNAKEVADFMVQRTIQHLATHTPNIREAKHPLTSAIPLLGKLFSIDKVEQFGHFDTVNATQPHAGPAMRLVINITDFSKSRWILPFGNSGHATKRAYKSMQSIFEQGSSLPIFWKPMHKDPRWVRLTSKPRRRTTL
ncbi:MAG: penicillin acylase family protein [Zetaproteobacteria bacterium]|nr:penicillin acylase family protein [Zetaproteobacteria bacterium]